MPCDCLRIIESKSKVRNSRNKPVVAKVSSSSSTPSISPDVDELKDMVKALLLDKKSQAPTPVKAVEECCVTCAAAANNNQGNTGYRSPIANQIRLPGFPPVIQPPAYQAPPYQAPAPQIQGMTKTDFESYVKANDAVMRNMQDQNKNMQNQMTNLTDMLSKFVNANTASSSGMGSLPSNTVTNPKEDLKGITTRSGVAYQGPTIPTTSSSPKVVERKTEPVVISVSALMPNLKPTIPYPSRRNDERRREKANDQIEKFYEIFKDLSFEISLTDALILMPKFASTLKALIKNKEKLSEMARTLMDECLALADLGASINLMPLSMWKRLSLLELTPTFLGFSNVILSGNPTPYYDPIISTSSPTLTPFGDSDFLLEEVNAFLALDDDPTSPKGDDSYYDLEGDIILLEAYLNDDPSPLPNQGNYFLEIQKELKVCEAKTDKSLIDEPPEVKLKDLPPHLEYAFLEGDDKLPIIIAKDLSVEEKAALIKVLKSRKRAIAWKLSDIKGINPKFYTHKILMEEDYKPEV
ncbi:hypothetical protein Tco_1023306 [Tanacetum coccineum]